MPGRFREPADPDTSRPDGVSGAAQKGTDHAVSRAENVEELINVMVELEKAAKGPPSEPSWTRCPWSATWISTTTGKTGSP